MATSAPVTGISRFLLEALGKFAAAQLRNLGALMIYRDWESRAAICERCAMRVIRRGVSYCGNPLPVQIERDPAVDGCGCPCHSKAKSPSEHCPVDARYQPAEQDADECSCKWCVASR